MPKHTKYKPEVSADEANDFVMPGVRWYQYEDMRHYVRDCADRMGLRDWTAEYYKVPPEELPRDKAVSGFISCEPRRLSFTIWLPPHWYELASGTKAERREARQTVAHELLHVKFVAIDLLIEGLYTNLGEQAHGLLKEFYANAMEQFIDDMASIADAALPLPRVPTALPERWQRKTKSAKHCED